MNAGRPPEKPGWFARLLELGNHNKVIAAATLITLATGVPYVVMTVVRAVTGEEDADAVVDISEMRTLFADALADSRARLEAEAEAHAVQVSGDLAKFVAAQVGGLETLRDAAEQPAATAEERERILDALVKHAQGEPEAALRELARVAEAQEARGARQDAADTWRRRAALQQLPDGRSALADYQRAEALAPGSAAVQLEMSSLLSDFVGMDAMIPVVRTAIERARQEGDRETLGQSLAWFGSAGFTRWAGDPAFRAEQHAALVEAAEVFHALLVEHPGDPRLPGQFAETVLMLGEAAGGDAEDLESLLARIDEVRARVEQVGASADPAWLAARAMLAAARGVILLGLERREEGLASMDRCMELHDAAWAAGAVAPRDKIRLWRSIIVCADVAKAARDMERTEAYATRGLASIRAALEDYRDNPAGTLSHASALMKMGASYYWREDYETAAGYYRESRDVALQARDLFGSTVQGELGVFWAHFAVGLCAVHFDEALAVEELRRAQRIFDERLADSPAIQASYVAGQGEQVRTMLAELEAADDQ